MIVHLGRVAGGRRGVLVCLLGRIEAGIVGAGALVGGVVLRGSEVVGWQLDVDVDTVVFLLWGGSVDGSVIMEMGRAPCAPCGRHHSVVSDQLQHGETYRLHVSGQMDGEFLPCRAGGTTEPALFRAWMIRPLAVAAVNNLPNTFRLCPSSAALLGLDLWLGHLVLAHQVLHKVVLAVAHVRAIGLVALPPF